MRPGILLLDEPLASLDPASAEETLNILRVLADEGMAILMVEHRVEDVLKIHPEQVIYLSCGEVRYQGSAQGLDESINYRDVKLPAPMIIERVKDLKEPMSYPEFNLPSTPPNTLVSFNKVGFFYEEGIPILHDVSLDIHHGDVIAVLGPNGAGKTTPGQTRDWAAQAKIRPGINWRSRNKQTECCGNRPNAWIRFPKPQPHVIRTHSSRGIILWPPKFGAR